jgi:hypothetical protein
MTQWSSISALTRILSAVTHNRYELTHPNLTEIIGVCIQQKPWLGVLEFVKYVASPPFVNSHMPANIAICFSHSYLFSAKKQNVTRAANRSDVCLSPRKSHSSSFNCTFMLPCNVHTYTLVVTNTHDP